MAERASGILAALDGHVEKYRARRRRARCQASVAAHGRGAAVDDLEAAAPLEPPKHACETSGCTRVPRGRTQPVRL